MALLYRVPGINYFYVLPRANKHAERIFRREIENILLYYNDNELRQRYRLGQGNDYIYNTSFARRDN